MERGTRSRRRNAAAIDCVVDVRVADARVRSRRAPARFARLAVLGGVGGLLLVVVAPAGARSVREADKAQLRYISASGSTLYETGRAIGTLPGTMLVHMRIEATFTGSFTISAQGGTIVGHGSATPHGAGVYESFAGTLVVTGGTGTYEHASGRAALYGTFDRKTYALTIKTSGTLHY